MDNTDAAKEKQEQIQQKQQEICNLKADLSSAYSEIGDWKIAKTYESRMNNEADPYDFAALTKARQEARDKINTLQQEIDALEKS
jgi:predicted  nucleic acid-binding Zn-ribbon protein